VLDETLLLFDQATSGRKSAAKQEVAEASAERAKGGENAIFPYGSSAAVSFRSLAGAHGGRLRPCESTRGAR
jgi:hypothetical protein